MRHSVLCLLILFFGSGLLVTTGCDSGQPEVAPRSEEEIAEYKKQVYGAEEEQDSEGDEDE